jgi:putative DNA primase/helicase
MQQQSARQPIDLVDTMLERELLFNDTTNANQLIAANGDKIRYVKGWGWMVYDGKRWKRDEGAVIALARETMQRLGADALKIENRQERYAKMNHYSRSLNRRNLQDMVTVAQSDKRIRAEADDFDTNPYLFNAQNGTIDLRTGELLDHDPEHLITQIAACDYDPDAWDETYADFVMWVANGRQDLHGYLQEALDYSLTGLTGEKCMFMCYGPEGDNGKSVLLEGFNDMMGDYGAPTDIGIVLSRGDKTSGPTPDLAALAGKRFVVASETEGGQAWRISQLKRITGGDTITASFKYENPFEFTPQFKIWLGTNSKPEVREGGKAVWERLKLIPFDNRIARDKRDVKLREKLKEAAPAILAWAVEGCKRYLDRGGLVEPSCMQEAQAEYQQEQDPFTAFVEECCEVDPAAWAVTKGGLLKAYEDWYYQTYSKYPDLRNRFERVRMC